MTQTPMEVKKKAAGGQHGASGTRPRENWEAIDGTAWAGRISGFQEEQRGERRDGVRADFTFSYKAERYRKGDFSGQRWPRALK
ncbi:hypothetical protein [Ralstonia solanacearum]|uniref:hypothetical protein n=1 Tax=Ralstonia solanacearum TaxID=305 RepID=UPI001E52670F|nr:hypothetical protein [Ralstonia solanacearum]